MKVESNTVKKTLGLVIPSKTPFMVFTYSDLLLLQTKLHIGSHSL